MGGVSRRGLRAGLLLVLCLNTVPAVLEAQTSAGVSLFGTGCRGPAGTPTMTVVRNSLPIIGREFQLSLTALPGAVYNTVFGVVGRSKTRWNGIPLPLDLTFMGITGCSMFVSPDHMEEIRNVGGSATWSMKVPNVSSIVGSTVYLQAWVIDGNANPGAVLVTNAGEAKVGTQ
jgi:hypothetical protein